MPTDTEFDFESRYRVDSYPGIAWYSIGYEKTWTEEEWAYDDTEDEESYVYLAPEEIENRDRVRCIMVGDDRVFTFDIEELTPIDDEDYCPECGQIGCKAYG